MLINFAVLVWYVNVCMPGIERHICKSGASNSKFWRVCVCLCVCGLGCDFLLCCLNFIWKHIEFGYAMGNGMSPPISNLNRKVWVPPSLSLSLDAFTLSTHEWMRFCIFVYLYITLVGLVRCLLCLLSASVWFTKE